MGQIVVTEFVSLDGVMQAPGPDGTGYAHEGWTFAFDRGDEGNQFKAAELFDAEAQLLGRVTYEGFAVAWPERAGTDQFADRMNGMPKYVFSNTLQSAEWNNSTILRGDLGEAVGQLKRDVEGNILVAGSCMLVQGMLAHGLDDELHLMVFPVVLGSGKRLFGDHRDKITLQLAEAKTVGEGVEILSYRAG